MDAALDDYAATQEMLGNGPQHEIIADLVDQMAATLQQYYNSTHTSLLDLDYFKLLCRTGLTGTWEYKNASDAFKEQVQAVNNAENYNNTYYQKDASGNVIKTWTPQGPKACQ